MPPWSATNPVWTEENIPVKAIAFVPVLPHPITENVTVYTAMKNFVEICSQLTQKEVPMYCDEGVYHIVREIQMLRQQEFKTIVPALGILLLTKAVLKCIGKYLSGMELISS